MEISFRSENMKNITVHLMSLTNSFTRHNLFVSEHDREAGRLIIPGDLLKDKGRMQLWLIGEYRCGRLKERKDITILAGENERR